MSELVGTKAPEDFRKRLLMTASTCCLVAFAGLHQANAADDVDHPTVWVELGGQLERIDGTGSRLTPPFTFFTPTPGPFAEASPIDAQRPPRYGYGGEGKISLTPEGTDWVISASIRYGRSSGRKLVQKQTAFPTINFTIGGAEQTKQVYQQEFAKTKANQTESHSVLDFQVGKDVGLGLFGRGSSSVLAAGVRFAQFAADASADIRARQNFHIYDLAPNDPNKYFPLVDFHAYTAIGNSKRSFHGLGPSLSWNASTPLIGNSDTLEVALDWGINAAALFGRQKAHIDHHTADRHFRPKYNHPQPPGYPAFHYSTVTNAPPSESRSRSVTVPNLGGFIGLSFRSGDSMVNFGYRGDIFFNAVDGGIDERKSMNLSFHGPFAKISVGLGG